MVRANSFGFDQALLTPQEGGVSVRVLYDFSDFAMFGGSVDIIYDHNAIEFERFEMGLFPTDAELASPVGELTEPGLIEGFGLRTTNFFEGISSQGILGTFYFTLIGEVDAASTPCGLALCLVPNAVNPFVSLVGFEVSGEILGNGIGSAAIAPVPLPGALWCLLSGLGWLVCARSKEEWGYLGTG